MITGLRGAAAQLICDMSDDRHYVLLGLYVLAASLPGIAANERHALVHGQDQTWLLEYEDVMRLLRSEVEGRTVKFCYYPFVNRAYLQVRGGKCPAVVSSQGALTPSYSGFLSN